MCHILVTYHEYYGKMIDCFVDNAVAVTNLANNLAMVNMETIQVVADTNGEVFASWNRQGKKSQEVPGRALKIKVNPSAIR